MSLFNGPQRFRVPAKWVLAGEHAVLRGGPAIALPHPRWGLSVTLSRSLQPGVRVQCADARFSALCEELVVEARARLRTLAASGELKSAAVKDWTAAGRPAPLGLEVELVSDIPIGGGLGSSAALCVAVARIAAAAHNLELTPPLERRIATDLENRFHGQSSGMDVAVASAAEPLLYTRGEEPRTLGSRWASELPITFHDTRVRLSTREAIERVESLRERDLDAFEDADARMGEATLECVRALLQPTMVEVVPALARGMLKAQSSYAAWGLMPPEAEELAMELIGKGALACKLTGAGGGGFLLALWPLSRYTNPSF